MKSAKIEVSVFTYRGFKIAVAHVDESNYKARGVRLRDPNLVVEASGTSGERARQAIKRQVDALIGRAVAIRSARMDNRQRAARMLERVISGELLLSSVRNYGQWLTGAQRDQLFRYILEKGVPGEAIDLGFPLSTVQRKLLAVTMYTRRMSSVGRVPTVRSHTRLRKHRTPPCYACGRGLDNAVDHECACCGWIICVCGACGCRSDYRSTFEELFGESGQL